MKVTTNKLTHSAGVFLTALLLSSCGGGGGAPAASSPPTPITVGEVQAEGTVGEPMVNAVGAATFTGIAGTITKATLRDTSPSLGETEIYYARTREIRACAPDGTRDRLIYTHTIGLSNMWLSGGRLIFKDANADVASIPVTGGALTPVDTVAVNGVAFDKAGLFRGVIRYVDGFTQPFRENTDGTGSTQLTTSAVHKNLVGMVGDYVVYVRNTAPEFSYASRPGVNRNFITYSTAVSTAIHSIRASDNARVAAVTRDDVASGGEAIDVFSVDLTTYPYAQLLGTIIDSTSRIGSVSVSPDGTHIVYSKGLTTTNSNQLFTAPVSSLSSTRIKLDMQTFSPQWGPFVETRPFIGGGGSFAGGGSAMLWSQVGRDTRCVVLADAVTRNSTTITPLSSAAGAEAALYKLTCDNLNKLYYTNDNSFKLQPLVTAASGLRGAILTFSTLNGDLVSAVTFNATPTVTTEGGKTVISGEGLVEVLKPDGTRQPAGNRIVVGN